MVFNEKHPVLALFGSSVLDLTILGCDPTILFQSVGAEDAELAYDCGDKEFAFSIPDTGSGSHIPLVIREDELDISGMAPVLPGVLDIVSVKADDDPTNGHAFLAYSQIQEDWRFRVPDGAGGGENALLSGDGKLEIRKDNSPILVVEDGVIDTRGSANDWTIKFGDGAEFAFERGQLGGYVFTNENIEDGGLNKIMFRNSVDGVSFNEFHFREGGVSFASPYFEFVDEETGGFTADVAIDDNLLDASGSTIKGRIFSPNAPSCSDADIADGGFVFWRDGSVVNIVLRMGSECFVAPMTLTALP